MNKVILIGRLGADAELKMTQSGQAILKLSLATSEKYTDKSGAKQEKTQWHRCTLWGERGGKLAQYLEKGKLISVEGAIEYGSYEKDGEKRYTTDIKVFNIELLGGKSDGGSAPPKAADDDGDDLGAPDSDIPF